MQRKIQLIGLAAVAALWLLLTVIAWFGPKADISETERRPLAQMPALSRETLLNGTFMEDFESYTLDQFPLRDAFRRLKASVHYHLLGQKDNNGIYIADGYAAELAYPLDTESVDHALGVFRSVYDRYLKNTGSTIYTTVIPDKGCYLAEENGYLRMDHDALFQKVKKSMVYATYVDITDCLQTNSYYRTDTHWRQEALLPVAQRLSAAMGLTAPKQEDYTKVAIDRPFYGVYYGQAALPMEPDTVYLLQNDALSDCRVYSYEQNAYTEVYNMDKLTSKDLYDVYLSGAESLLRIENPNANTDRELIVFRDSYASSLIPLLVGDYQTVTLIDLRYLHASRLDRFVDFHGQDVLFIHSALVLNKKLI